MSFAQYIKGLVPAPGPVERPLEITEEIVDNGAFLEELIEEMIYVADLPLESTKIYETLKIARSVKQGGNHQISATAYGTNLRHRDRSGNWLPWDLVSDELMDVLTWVGGETLPGDIRKRLVDLFMTLDHPEEHLRVLPQSRWEKLRMWSAQHV